MTNSRHKLNAAAIHGALLVAGLIAAVTQSWTIFVVLLVILLTTAVISGDIRLTGRPR